MMAITFSNCLCSPQTLGISSLDAQNSYLCSPSSRSTTSPYVSPFRCSFFQGVDALRILWKEYRTREIRDGLGRGDLGLAQNRKVFSAVKHGVPVAFSSKGCFVFRGATLCRQRRCQLLFGITCMVPHKGTGVHKGEVKFSSESFGMWPEKGLSSMLPYVVVVTAIAALVQPATFAWVSKEYYTPALGGIMLSIGVQLSVRDFSVVLQKPLAVLLGYSLQYLVKPLLGLLVARAFHVSSAFDAGFILMSSVSGAQLTSYASFLSEGDIALSVVLTSLSTVTSVIMTPLLTGVLIGSIVPVDGVAMAKSIMQVVLGPVALGLVLNTYAKSAVDAVRPFLPLMAMVCTSMCIGSPLALNRAQIVSVQGVHLLFPVVVFHITAFAIGYWISKLPVFSQDEKVSRTLSLSAGMQSSTLAGLLANQFLGGTHAVPSACSVVVMAVLGLSLASFWGKGERIRDIMNDSRGLMSKGVSETDTPFLPQKLRTEEI